MRLYKYIIVGLSLILFTAEVCGQKKKNKPKPKASGRYIPRKTRLNSATSSRNTRTRKPTLGEVLRRSQQNQGRPSNNQGSRNSEWTRVNGMYSPNHARTNNQVNNQNFNTNTRGAVPIHYTSIGKVVPPLQRAEGDKPPAAPSWTHCVTSVQVSVAWVIVTSPGYPKKFQGQVQCSWIVTAPTGYGVRLSFKALDLLPPNGNGCGNQFVEVIDMHLKKAQARFCGKSTPGDYVSAGNKLRLDLQADAIATPYKGFMAAFRADKEVPGRRETSYFSDGQPQGLYNPLIDAPPSNPQMPRQRNTRKPTSTRRPNPGIPGQRIYGAKDQPRLQNDESAEENLQESSTTHLYIIIIVVVVILSAGVAAYVFKRYLYKQAKAWWEKRKHSAVGEMQHGGDGQYAMKNMQLPGNMPLPPTPGRQSSLTRSTSSNDDVYFDRFHSPYHSQTRPPSYGQATAPVGRSHSLDDFDIDWSKEPIYEDDALSLHSVASSVRSSNRHADHERFKHHKLQERFNSMRSGSFAGDYRPTDGTMYPVYNPYKANGYREMYGYDDPENTYGSLPPTFSPGHLGYDLYDSRSAGQLSPRSLVTSSTTNIPGSTVNHNDFMMQQYQGRSASLYDLTTAGLTQPASMSSQSLSQNPRLTSVTSSTSTGTNPILKKTKPVQQSELAVSALRAAKSMNDLTAINTKLNECVSWTLPSQRRKSVFDLP